MSDIKAKANHAAWERWQAARKVAAREKDIREWQRLNRFCTLLDPYVLASQPSK